MGARFARDCRHRTLVASSIAAILLIDSTDAVHIFLSVQKQDSSIKDQFDYLGPLLSCTKAKMHPHPLLMFLLILNH